VASTATGVFGQLLNVTWVVRNIGTGPTFANWNDELFLTTTSNVLAGATLLGSVAAPNGLAAGQSYTNTSNFALHLDNTWAPGAYYLVVQADAGDSQPESNEANNLRSRFIPLTLPPRPDLTAAQVSSPSLASPGETIAVTWVTTNQGPATAI